MKYILETSEPLSEAIRELIKEKVPYAHVESIKPLIVDERELEELANEYAYSQDGWDDVPEERFKAFKMGYHKAMEE